jgi:transcriptional regulator GlxA family with amidase domain
MQEIIVILFNNFETLDVFGPVEILGRLKEEFNIHFHSLEGGIIESRQDVPILTKSISEINLDNYVLVVPGGIGTRELVTDDSFLNYLKTLADNADYVLTICTGSILLSKTGFLDGKQATTNKRVFAWTNESPKVNWIKKARWVNDGNIYTSSGVSAGMDMALGFVSDLFGYEVAKKQSWEIEYDWKEDPSWDPFSEVY